MRDSLRYRGYFGLPHTSFSDWEMFRLLCVLASNSLAMQAADVLYYLFDSLYAPGGGADWLEWFMPYPADRLGIVGLPQFETGGHSREDLLGCAVLLVIRALGAGADSPYVGYDEDRDRLVVDIINRAMALGNFAEGWEDLCVAAVSGGRIQTPRYETMEALVGYELPWFGVTFEEDEHVSFSPPAEDGTEIQLAIHDDTILYYSFSNESQYDVVWSNTVEMKLYDDDDPMSESVYSVLFNDTTQERARQSWLVQRPWMAFHRSEFREAF